MNLAQFAKFAVRTRRIRPKRYRNVLQQVYRANPATLVEIGVFDGLHARDMIETAKIARRPDGIRYFGFDLFEDLTAELLEKELSKKPPTRAQVAATLGTTGATIELIKGFTKDTLPAFGARGIRADFIFIDGGHSDETIRGDWAGVQPLLHDGTVVLFDDYYPVQHEKLKGFGCQELIRELAGAGWRVELLDPVDKFEKSWGEFHVQMVTVRR